MSNTKQKFSVRDPLWGFIPVSPLEASLLEAPPVQRLRRIKQMGFSSFVFPGAEHSRLTHALGSMSVATRILDRLLSAAPKLLSLPKYSGTEKIRTSVREKALLADVGIFPFSTGHQDTETPATVALNKDFYSLGTDMIVAESIINEIVFGPLGAKVIDRLLRDSFFCGVQYGSFDIDRLLETIVLVEDPRTLAWRLGVVESGLHTLESMLAAQSYMHDQIYCNEVVAAFELHYERWLQEEVALDLLKEDDWSITNRLRQSDSEHAKVLHGMRQHRYICIARGTHGNKTNVHDQFFFAADTDAACVLRESAYWRLDPEQILILRADGRVSRLEEISSFARYLRPPTRLLVFSPRGSQHSG